VVKVSSLLSTCRCGHDRPAHQHYRAGSDCGLCDCVRFVLRLPFLGRGDERRDGAGG
jgi:hypothetical protein